MKTCYEFANFEQIEKKVLALKTDSIFFIVDERVWFLYKESLPCTKVAEGKNFHVWIAPRGEEAKRIGEFEKCVEFILEKGVHRNSHLVAIGGGAVSDMAGFVASTILRGITWSIIPTTLLGMVDASIGGKVAINSRFGKNLIGAFHSPQNVWINTDFLNSLPEDELESGNGEIIKYAFLSSEIYEAIMNDVNRDSLIDLCVRYKMDFVTRDPYEKKGIRRVLNLGHTFGHALEKTFSLRHGHAVVWGMVLLFQILNRQDLLDKLNALRINLGWHELPPPWSSGDVPINKILSYVDKDKKICDSKTISIVCLEDIGKPCVQDLSLEEFKIKMQRALNG